MSFGAQGFLLYGLLGLLPVILYILFRLRRRSLHWGASYILHQMLRRRVKERRWRQYVVLALRSALPIVLAMAFALPFLKTEGVSRKGFPHGEGSLTRVVLLDNSESMLALHGDTTRFEEARRLTEELMKGAGGGDRFVVIPLTGEVRTFVFEPPFGKEGVRRTINSITLSPSAIRMTQALELASRQFLSSVTTTRQLIILSDFAGKDFRTAEALVPFARLIRELGVECYLHRIAMKEDSNASLVSAGFGTDRLLEGQTYNLYADVMNYSTRALRGRRLLLLEKGEILQQKEFELLPGEKKSLRLPVRLTGGLHTIELRLQEDAFPLDNDSRLVVSVRKKLSVFILREDVEREKGFKSESEFVLRALESAQSSEAYRIEVESGNEIESLDEVDVVIVAGVKLDGTRLAKRLKDYVRLGGGLVVGFSPERGVSSIRKTMNELCGVELLEPYLQKTDYERYLFIEKDSAQERLLREFALCVNADISKARIYNHIRLKVVGKQAKVLMRFSNGDPALVMSRNGRGVVVFWASSLSGRWNSLVVRQAFLPLMYRLIALASSGRELPLNITRGEIFIQRIDSNRALFVTTPDGKLYRARVTHAGARSFLTFEETRAPGLYAVTDEEGEMVLRFSVSDVSDESDIRPLSSEKEKFLLESFSSRFTSTEEELRRAMQKGERRVKLTGLLVLSAVVLLLLEFTIVRMWF